jgi:transcriptional regulator with XRE-family HTH domain
MPPADTPTGSAVPRRVLGQYLRDLRQQAGLTVKLAASLMEWSEPKLWRIETGQTALRALDVQTMCAAYGTAPGLIRVAGGLVDILHAGVVVATHAQRLREDQADRAPQARVARWARDATAGLTVTRLADHDGTVTFAGTTYRAGRQWARTSSM